MSVESKISKVLRMVENNEWWGSEWSVKILNNMYFKYRTPEDGKLLTRIVNSNKYKSILNLTFPELLHHQIQIESTLTNSSILELIAFVKEVKQNLPKITSAYFLDYESRENPFPSGQIVVSLTTDVFTFSTLLKLLLLISLNVKLKRLFLSNADYSNIPSENEKYLVLNKLLSEFNFSPFKSTDLSTEDKKYLINSLIKYLQEKLNIEKLDNFNLVLSKKLFYILPEYVMEVNQNYIEDITVFEEFGGYLNSLLETLNKAFEESSSNPEWNNLESILDNVLVGASKKSLAPVVQDIKNEMLSFIKTSFVKKSSIFTLYTQTIIHDLLNRPKADLDKTSRILNSFIEKKGAMLSTIVRNVGYNNLFTSFYREFFHYVRSTPELKTKLMDNLSSEVFMKIVSSENMKSFFTEEFKKHTGNLLYYGTLMVIFQKMFYSNVIVTNHERESSEGLSKVYNSYIRFCEDIKVKCYDTGLKLRILLENLLKVDYEKYNGFFPADITFDYEHLPLDNRVSNSINLLKIMKDDFKHCLDNESSSENTVLKKVVNHIKGGFIIYENYINFNINLLDYYLKTFEGLV